MLFEKSFFYSLVLCIVLVFIVFVGLSVCEEVFMFFKVVLLILVMFYKV